MELKEYQKSGIDVLKKNLKSYLVCDDMGLGKTATSLASIKNNLLSGERWIVICPASLKLNWCREINMWLGYAVTPDNPDKKIYVTNYERMGQVYSYMQDREFNGVIFDEAHYLKNKDSLRHLRAKRIADRLPQKLLLTGTPMSRGPTDIASLLSIMGKLGEFGGYDRFYKDFCDPYYNSYGWDFDGSYNTDLLNRRLSDIMLRRTKGECEITLPNKTLIDVPIITLSQKTAQSFREIEEFQREVNDKKFESAVQFLIKLRIKGKRPVVFIHHKDLLKRLQDKFGDSCVTIHGGQNMYQREKAIRMFQGGEVPYIICSLQASATGLTLTSSDTAVFLEYLWSPAVHDQAQNRIHRLSQTRDCTIYNLYAKGSIECQKLNTSNWKKHIMKGVI